MSHQKEDHEHRIKRCPHLDQPIPILCDSYVLVHTNTEGCSLCLDHLELSLRWDKRYLCGRPSQRDGDTGVRYDMAESSPLGRDSTPSEWQNLDTRGEENLLL